MEADDVYFLKKNGRPSADKDRVRNSIANCALSHLKTRATVLKSVHQDPDEPRSYKEKDDVDLAPYLMYSLNKKRRWEAEENIGVELLDRVSKLNNGWKSLVVERVNLRTYVWPEWSYASNPERYTDYFMIRKVHELKDSGYQETALNSVFGQRYSHFLEENRKPKKGEKKEDEVKEPLVVYNFLRAPDNYVPLLQKQFQSSNYGWDWPHSCYWRRVERLKDSYLDLRYGEVESEEDHTLFVNSHEDDNAYQQQPRTQFYNLEDHIVDKFVMVKNRRGKSSRRAD